MPSDKASLVGADDCKKSADDDEEMLRDDDDEQMQCSGKRMHSRQLPFAIKRSQTQSSVIPHNSQV